MATPHGDARLGRDAGAGEGRVMDGGGSNSSSSSGLVKKKKKQRDLTRLDST